MKAYTEYFITLLSIILLYTSLSKGNSFSGMTATIPSKPTILTKIFKGIQCSAVTNDHEKVSKSVITLSGVVVSAFNSINSSICFHIEGETFPTDPTDVYIYHQGLPVSENHIEVTKNKVTLKSILIPGKNRIDLNTEDKHGGGIDYSVSVWAGDCTLTVSIVDKNAEPVDGVSVTALLAEDTGDTKISTNATSVNGQVIFNNIPPRTTITLEAIKENQFAVSTIPIKDREIFSKLTLRAICLP